MVKKCRFRQRLDENINLPQPSTEQICLLFYPMICYFFSSIVNGQKQSRNSSPIVFKLLDPLLVDFDIPLKELVPQIFISILLLTCEHQVEFEVGPDRLHQIFVLRLGDFSHLFFNI